ncbi:MAG: archease [Candidatus Aenigmarchaeota archaeon]|nr:archease [Candidatus Aenigmarchaeota archaeon]
MPYKFLPDIAVADVAFEATGRTLDELLEQAALATTNVMVKELKTVKHKVSKKITVKAESEEMLLFNFLQEIIFHKDADLLLFSAYNVGIKKTSKGFALACTAKGEKLDMKKHELMVDVKAVTLHMFEVKKTKGGWKAHVILDI